MRWQDANIQPGFFCQPETSIGLHDQLRKFVWFGNIVSLHIRTGVDRKRCPRTISGIITLQEPMVEVEFVVPVSLRGKLAVPVFGLGKIEAVVNICCSAYFY